MALTRPKQHEIAEALNIARTTVTKVLNHDPVYRVAPETREMILNAAKEMGYAPRRRRSNNIAIVVAREMLLGFNNLVLEANKEAALLNNRLFLVHTASMPSYEEIKYYVNPLCADGLLLLGDFPDQTIERFASIMPVVLIDDRPCDLPVDRVCGNFSMMAGAMADYLIECGHTRIATILDTLQSEVARDIVAGVSEALRRADVEPDPFLVWEKRLTSPQRVIQDILEHPAKPTAIIAMTIEEHLTYLSLLAAMGAKVPEDMSYVAWDNCNFRSMSHFPDMTRLAGHIDGLAKTGVRRLMQRIENRCLPVECIQAPWHMHLGGTCRRLRDAEETYPQGIYSGSGAADYANTR